MSDPKSTLDKIQREIRENLKREDELKKGHLIQENGNHSNRSSLNGTDVEISANVYSATIIESSEKVSVPNGLVQNGAIRTNGISSAQTEAPKTNGFRKFVPHNASKGVMQKFFKSRGRLGVTPIQRNKEVNDNWYNDTILDPPKVNPEKGKPVRKNYIPAEEKIERELTDFQQREEELRKIRWQSQPDLMAALEKEEHDESEWVNGFKDYKNPKHTKSTANLYQTDDDSRSQDSSAPSSLKPARSLADLCDLSDEETGSSKLAFDTIIMTYC